MINIFKNSYSLKHIGFLIVNLFCIIIIFFVLDKETGGSFWMRLFAFIFCVVVGGLFGVYWSSKRNGTREEWFRKGAGILLVFFTLLVWSNNKGGYSTIDCSSDIKAYNDGFTHGRIISYASDATQVSCSDYIDNMAAERINLKESDCFCSGYYDGRAGRMNKHK